MRVLVVWDQSCVMAGCRRSGFFEVEGPVVTLCTSTEGEPIIGRPCGKVIVEGEDAEGFQGRLLVGLGDKIASRKPSVGMPRDRHTPRSRKCMG